MTVLCFGEAVEHVSTWYSGTTSVREAKAYALVEALRQAARQRFGRFQCSHGAERLTARLGSNSAIVFELD